MTEAAAPMPGPTGTLTPELIASLWQPTEVRLSPDGSRVAWSAAPFGSTAEHGDSALWVAHVGDPATARRWTHGGSDTTPRWSPDGSRLAFCSDRAERGTAGLYVLALDGGEGEPVAVRNRSVGGYAWSPDGRSLAVLAPDEPDDEDARREKERDDADVWGQRRQPHRVHRVDVAGATRTVWRPDLHVVEVAWSPAGDRLAVLARPTPDLDDMVRASVWVLASDGSGQPTRLAAAPIAQGLCWTSDGSWLAYVGPHDPDACSAHTVWAVPADGGDPRVVGPGRDEPRCVATTRAVPGDPRVVALVAEGLDTRLEWCDPASGSRSLLWEAPGDVVDVDVVRTGRGPVLAAVVGDGSEPTTVRAGTPEAVAVASAHHDALGGVRLGTVEDFAFTGSDGEPLDAVLVRPAVPVAYPAPTVLLLHGGPYGRSGRELHLHPLDWGQLLATSGYAVLMPNYRGGFGHGDAFAAAARAGMGTVEWDDVLAAADAVVERGIADPDRLGIGGWSQGGFLTAWAVTRTERFRAAVMGAGVSDWSMMAATSDLPTFEQTLGGSAPWDGPGPHHAAKGSPISYASRRTTPLLILHGQEDRRVPHSQAVAFHRALRDQQAPVELVSYPREPHGIGERRHQEDLMRRVREWFDRWL